MKRFSRSTVLTAGGAILLSVAVAAGVAAQGGRPGRLGPLGPGGPGGPGGPRQGGPGGPGRLGGPGGPLGVGIPIAQLGLTEDQQTQVRDVLQRSRQEMQAVGERLRTAHDAQRKAIEAVPLNEALIRSTADVLAAADVDMALLQGRIHNEIFSLLTPEQQAKATQINAEREARMNARQQQGKDRLQKRLKK